MVSVHKSSRWWRLIAFTLTFVTTAPAMADLQASVDHNPVSMGESVTLTLQSSDDLSGSPDLSILQQNFDILGQSRSSNFQIINGSTSRTQQWIITLMPKVDGSLLIPPLTIDGEHSAPLTLTVVPADQAQATQQRSDLFLEVSASPKSVYVQQQIVYTVKLFRSVDLGNNATLTEPKLSPGDAIVEKLGDDRNYQMVRNGVRYQVIERDYALYPQKSGSFTIPPLVFEGDVVQGGIHDPFGFDPFNTSTRHQRIVSTPVTINAKPQPAVAAGKQWLPARNLQLVEQWSQTPPTFTVGQPITRSVAIMADGLTAAQLPPLNTTVIDGLKEYPDQPSLKDTKASDGITGLRTEKVAMIPTRPGALTLPAIEVAWWDTATGKPEVARLPARTVTVLPATATNAPAPTQAPAPAPAKATTLSPISSATAAPITAPLLNVASAANRNVWPWIALFLGSGWLATLLAWWWRSRRKASPAKPDKASNDSLHHLERLIKASCQNDDAIGCGQDMLAWAKQRWPEHPPVSLTALAQRCPPQLAAALRELDRVLYAGTSRKWQDGDTFWQIFTHHKPASEKKAARSESNELRPLYSE